jgi:hypothetical protein
VESSPAAIFGLVAIFNFDHGTGGGYVLAYGFGSGLILRVYKLEK